MRIKVLASIINGEDESLPTQHFFESNEIIIGRSPHSDLCLGDPTLSAMHAKIFVSPDPNHYGRSALFLKDLGSSNGTAIENCQIRPFSEVPLAANRWVRLGMCLISATLDDSTESAELVNEIASLVDENGIGKAYTAKGSERAAEVDLDSTLKMIPSADGPILLQHEDVLEGGSETDDEEYSFACAGDDVDQAPEDLEATNFDDDAEELHSTIAVETNSGTEERMKSESARSPRFGQVSVQVTNSDIDNLDFEAYKLISLVGIVMCGNTPLKGVAVDGGSLGTMLTDDSGRFSFDNVREGSSYEISLSLDDHHFSPAVFRGNAAENVRLNALAERTFTISGKILHHGSPLADVEVDGGPLGKVITAEDGRYTFRNIRADTDYQIRASKDGFEFYRRNVHLKSEDMLKPAAKLKLVTNA